MGNVSGREEKSKGHNQEECYIGCAHSQVQVSSNYPAHLLHNPWASQVIQTCTCVCVCRLTLAYSRCSVFG